MMGFVISERDAADYLNVSTRTLQRLRESGGGPVYIRIGERRIGYRMSDIDDWLESQCMTSRADEYSRQVGHH